MATTIEAVYEDGVFKPLEPVKLENGQKVQVYIPWAPCDQTPEQAVESWRQLRESFAELSDEEWEETRQAWKRG